LLIVAPILIFGHGIMLCPPPRTGMATTQGTKYPGAPTSTNLNSCMGYDTAGSSQATFVAGQVTSIAWDTTIYHAPTPGVRIALACTGDNFSDNILAQSLDVGQVGDHYYNITIPLSKSGACVVQWIWNSNADGGFYIGCADITIIASGQSSGPDCVQGNIVSI